MQKQEILSHVDHTLLKQQATWREIEKICEEALENHTASVCIPPAFVKQAADFLAGRVPVCTVIGFPNGYQTTAVKAFETKDAVANGADEIDMVIHVGMVKEGRYEDVLAEINQVKEACDGRILKVIIETCMLTEEEKKELCRIVSRSNADYIKTSTGFGGGGATAEDVALFAEYTTDGTKIKAAGGIRSVADAEEFLRLGADRLGSSSLVAMLHEQD
ncbi:deoxyribose-phosphate aldolase [Anaerotignum lactatifermentans]|uniref:Deoxyribose-phosphate aldolase n=1 Tax=Anaerotignum lactatifermentans TaxID=160404 RepID=A0ABS2G6M9_9FIRM|nr:deoxyribose-phosphate aldolase [Anaerotignum lactatifermentans]MBM6828147.1 deoxyribose-phosphate aldolase [Anaerotignum lactatifermentans]MBM6876690.1 deoxyribose-phosphate aldolase [Anaerotignum lactatifermentans]MBM6949730.1 deoxyribose-phosphate aldolase [Anaerotignum lactatifermentans]